MMSMINNREDRILVTGASGGIGSELVTTFILKSYFQSRDSFK